MWKKNFTNANAYPIYVLCVLDDVDDIENILC